MIIDLRDLPEDTFRRVERALLDGDPPEEKSDPEIERLQAEVRRLEGLLEDWKGQVQSSNRCLANELIEVREELHRRPPPEPPAHPSPARPWLRSMGAAALLSPLFFGLGCRLSSLAQRWADAYDVPEGVLPACAACAILCLIFLGLPHLANAAKALWGRLMPNIDEDGEEDIE